MARGQTTLAELALRQQVRAANRVAFLSWFQGGVPPSLYRRSAVSAVVIVAIALAWRYLA